ncbi:site-specific DNA-methyltransferase [bacterium]|nr:site-specific DNA-methyltransferase [bacterium]
MPPSKKTPPKAESYTHTEATLASRPEVGVQAQFKHDKGPGKYRYDSSLAPDLLWDENPARERGEALIAQIQQAKTLEEAKAAAAELAAMSKPFLNWSGKAEQPELSVPSLPLFIHERLSTQAIIETLKGHLKDKHTVEQASLFGDPQRSITDQLLGSYTYPDNWVNRMILGDSLSVMNSLVEFEGMAGKVQMIYMDPPYGVKYGSNFQPFVRKRDVAHGADSDMSREPEMVKAYRDTWELGLHSYLSYMRDRLRVARNLLSNSGSIFVQISDENIHHVREVLDEVMGSENFAGLIAFAKTSSFTSGRLSSVYDYCLWYARDIDQLRYNQLWVPRIERTEGGTFSWIESESGIIRRLSAQEMRGEVDLPTGKRFRADNIVSPGFTASGSGPIVFEGKEYRPSPNSHWKTSAIGMQKLIDLGRVIATGKVLAYKRFESDFPLMPIANVWEDTILGTFTDKLYVVQTGTLTIQRCILMTTEPGDLILDPTCGSGTSAFVAEQWGRRWITIDVSRVPLALARQRLLTATFDYYELKDSSRGPAGGFNYKRKQNKKGEEVGGIVPRITLGSIANNEPPEEVVLVDRPEVDKRYVRVSGPFCVEAVIPTPLDLDADGDGTPDFKQPNSSAAETHADHIQRMTKVLSACPVINLTQGETIELEGVRSASDGFVLNAEATLKGNSGHSVGIVFGPQSGAVSEKLAVEANQEAYSKGCKTLLVMGYAFEAKALEYLANCGKKIHGTPAHAVTMTPDLMMGDLLKNMRSSQIFSVAGRPDVRLLKSSKLSEDGEQLYRVRVLGLDTVNPETMDSDELKGDNLPAWLLDTDYNGNVFHVCQAFFPRTRAWDALKKALKADYDESVWAHLSSTVSSLFPAGKNGQIAVKVIDDRGNELITVKAIADALELDQQNQQDNEALEGQQ